MAIQPATARLLGGSSQTFTCDLTDITWVELDQSSGSLVPQGQSCVYTAPHQSLIWLSRDVVLTAKDKSGVARASAIITLVSAPVWIATLTVTYVLLFLLLVFGVLKTWPPPAASPLIEVSPAIVTVPHGYMQQFEARIWHSRDQSVTWSVNDGLITPNGLFTAPASGKQVLLTVTSTADHNLGQSALIILDDHQGLYVQPSTATLSPGAALTFKARSYQNSDVSAAPPAKAVPEAKPVPDSKPSFEWIASDPAPDLFPDQNSGLTVRAPARITSLKRVVLTLVDKADRARQASAVVYLTPTEAPLEDDLAETELSRDKTLVRLVFLMGALGALLGASRSLANFVGNDTFVARWTLFYLLRPTFGAGLAVLVFFGYRIGAISTVKGAAPADPFAATFIAGMVGLFADTVLQKLKDVIMALFPSQDERKDKVSSASLVPVIDSIEASSATKTMTIKGRNFATGAAVTINGKPRTATHITAEQITVTLDTADTGEVRVVVANPDNATVEFAAKIGA